MAGTLTYQIVATFVSNGKTLPVQGVTFEQTLGDAYKAGVVLVTQAEAVTLDSVASPKVGYFRNLDATNFVTVLDDAAELAVVPAGQAALIQLPAGVTLKAQANTANCLMDYAVFAAS